MLYRSQNRLLKCFAHPIKRKLFDEEESENDASGHENENVIDNSNMSPKTTSFEENIVRKHALKVLTKNTLIVSGTHTS